MSKKSIQQVHPHFSKLFTDNLFMTKEAVMSFVSNLMLSDNQGVQIEIPSYKAESLEIAKMISSEDLSITTSFNETDIPDESIAFHRIVGPIFAEYDRWGWYFSTKQYIDDIRSADRNPQIIAHFNFVNSGGGEAWYLEKAHQAVLELKKPIITFIEKRCCSAGYYIVNPTNRIFSATINDIIGSIGVMVAFWDMVPYFEELGFKWHEHYADQSKLKNKAFNKLLNDKPKKYKEKELNPLAEQFINAVRSGRQSLADLPKKHDVFAGETYRAENSGEVGLIDEISELEFALNYTLQQGLKFKEKMDKQIRMQTLIHQDEI